jgi:predicted MFS family arabinose efflux permease
MAAALGIGRFAYTPLLPQMVTDGGWDYGQAGDLASANFVGYFVGALLAPLLAGAAKVRLLLAFSMMASVITTYFGAEVQTYTQWLVMRFAAGVASAFCLVIVTSQLMQTLRSERAEHLGNIHFAGVGLGILLCMAGVNLAGTVDEQWARQGVLAALCMAFSWILVSSGPWHVKQPQSEVLNQPGVTTPILRLVVGYGLFGFGYVVSATFVVAMGERISNQGLDANIAWVVVGASTVVSVYLWQWFAQRRGLRIALIVSYLVLAMGAFLAGWAQSIWLLLVAAALLGGTFGGITALGLSAGRALTENIAWIVSLMTVAFSLGQLLGPAVAGRLADAMGGFFWPSLLAATVVVIAALLVPREKRLAAN